MRPDHVDDADRCFTVESPAVAGLRRPAQVMIGARVDR